MRRHGCHSAKKTLGPTRRNRASARGTLEPGGSLLRGLEPRPSVILDPHSGCPIAVSSANVVFYQSVFTSLSHLHFFPLTSVCRCATLSARPSHLLQRRRNHSLPILLGAVTQALANTCFTSWKLLKHPYHNARTHCYHGPARWRAGRHRPNRYQGRSSYRVPRAAFPGAHWRQGQKFFHKASGEQL